MIERFLQCSPGFQLETRGQRNWWRSFSRFVLGISFLLSSPQSVGASVDAALSVDDRIYLFNGQDYARYKLTGAGFELDGGIRSLPGEWSGLPDSFSNGIDAAFYFPPTQRIYMFKDGTYIRLKGTTVEAAYTTPKKLPGGWKGLPTSFHQGIDAAVFRGGHSYFFRGGKYVRFTGYQLDQRYKTPRKLPGGWQLHKFKAGLDAATMLADTKKGFFFSGDDYVRLKDTRLYGRNAYADIERDWKGAHALNSGTYSRLENESAYLHLTDGKIMSIRPGPSNSIRSDDVFKRYGFEFKLTQDDRMTEVSRRTSTSGTTHIRFKRTHNGIPVVGGGFVISERDDTVTAILGQVIDSENIATTPIISKAQALANVFDSSGTTRYLWQADGTIPKPELVLLGVDENGNASPLKLAYRLKIESVKPLISETVFVDANNGDVILRVSNILQSPVISTGDTLFYGRKKFRAESFSDEGKTRYRLRAPTKGTHPLITTKYMHDTATGQVDIKADTNEFISTPIALDSESNFVITPMHAAVSAHWATQEVERYWNRYESEMPFEKMNVLVSEVADVCPAGAQACYNAENNRIALLPFSGRPYTGLSLSVIAHEYTHALYSSLEQRYSTGEAAVINEGLADLFGWLVHQNPHTPYSTHYVPDHFIEFNNSPGNNRDQEDCNSEQTVCRELFSWTYSRVMDYPQLSAPFQPILYKGKNYLATSGQCIISNNDYCHHNASLVPYWFRLTWRGDTGTNELGNYYKIDGIGFEAAESIITHAFLYMMTGIIDFHSLREATIQSAATLYGEDSKETVGVIKAWYAVGVGDNFDTRSYRPITSLDTPEIEPWPARLSWKQLDNEVDWDVQVSQIPFSEIKSDSARRQIISLKRTSSEIKVVGLTERILWAGTTVNLKPDHIYYWRVRSKKLSLAPGSPRQRWGEWGKIQSFKTAKKNPKIISPRSKKSAHPWNTKFSWEKSSGATRYLLLVSEDKNIRCKTTGLNIPDRSNVLKNIPSGLAAEESHEIALKAGTNYYWWLKTIGPDDIAGGCSNDGKPIEFSTRKPKAELLEPPDGATVSPFLVPLDWKNVKGAKAYKLSVREASGSALPIRDVDASNF